MLATPSEAAAWEEVAVAFGKRHARGASNEYRSGGGLGLGSGGGGGGGGQDDKDKHI
jgi:hypothetical protein